MARPKIPLISRDNALKIALDIIDTEGIDSLSIRRLAERLKVNGASLYHHFDNKEEIVLGAANLALSEYCDLDTDGVPFPTWLLRNAQNLRQAFQAHPDLVSVMLRGQPFGIGVVQMDAMAALLEKEDVPVGAVVPLLEALEFYTVGSALNEVSRASSSYDGEGIPHLSRAARLRALTPDEIFDIVCEQLIDVIIRTVLEKEAVAEQEKAASVPAPRLRSRKAGRNSADAKA